jgi:hypothetical protein
MVFEKLVRVKHDCETSWESRIGLFHSGSCGEGNTISAVIRDSRGIRRRGGVRAVVLSFWFLGGLMAASATKDCGVELGITGILACQPIGMMISIG